MTSTECGGGADVSVSISMQPAVLCAKYDHMLPETSGGQDNNNSDDHYHTRIVTCDVDSTSSTSDGIGTRFLCADDLPAVKALCAQLFPIEYPDCWYSDITQNAAYYSLAAVDAHNKHQLIGLLVAEARTLNQCNMEDRDVLSKSFPANTRVSYILSLGVAREYRRRGVASRLLDHYLTYVNNHSMQVADGDSIRAVYLHVLHSNTSAITFYQNRHFRRHRRLREYYRIGDSMADGLTYVLYVNGGRADYSIGQCIAHVLACACSPFRRAKRVLCALAVALDHNLQLNLLPANNNLRRRLL